MWLGSAGFLVNGLNRTVLQARCGPMSTADGSQLGSCNPGAALRAVLRPSAPLVHGWPPPRPYAGPTPASPRAASRSAGRRLDAVQYVLGAVRAGAAWFLVKPTPPEDLTGLVQVAAEGHIVLSPAAARRLIVASADRQPARERARHLARSFTDREAQVLACLGEGLSNAQIAARLYLPEARVKGYVSRMLDKLGCANRTQAGLLAHDAGLASGPS